ncbi:MAG TPA: vanadium-dependent haloperoxidase [Acidobacteriota bacterium]|nr:vanadium-dependent haloperoxidase [Acidobacteriota bacterium]
MLIQNVYEKQNVSSRKKLSLLKKVLPLIIVSMFLSASARADVVTYWNEVATNSIVRAGKSPGIHFAMVHAAIYDAVNSIDRRYTVFAVKPSGKTRKASQEAAAASAAYNVLLALFPEQKTTLDAAYGISLAAIPDSEAKTRGIAIGEEVAAGIMELRANDGRNNVVQYSVGSGPGVYQLTPPAFSPPATPWLAQVKPFALLEPSQFRAEGPPALTSEQYAADFNEVKRLGSANSTERTAEQTETGRFHTESPPTFWSRNLRQLAIERELSVADNARLFAIFMVTYADVQIAGWDSKYHYNFWRPVTAIRAADTDDNPATEADANWTPLAVTPPHPEYPAAHGFGTAAFAEILRQFFGTKNITMTFTSTVTGTARTYTSTDDLIKDVIEARIYGGMHFRTSIVDGTVLGKKVAKWIAKHHFRPVD